MRDGAFCSIPDFDCDPDSDTDPDTAAGRRFQTTFEAVLPAAKEEAPPEAAELQAEAGTRHRGSGELRGCRASRKSLRPGRLPSSR